MNQLAVMHLYSQHSGQQSGVLHVLGSPEP